MNKPKHMSAECIQRGDSDPDTVAQTLAFGNAIMAGIEQICMERHNAALSIDMRAVIGALVSVMAHYIAGIPDDDSRQYAFRRTGEELADMITTNIELGTYAKTYSNKDFVQ